jgi:ATP-dependent Clp protease ATP-binding subunit ClpC
MGSNLDQMQLALKTQLQHLNASIYLVAVSGGLDSMLLLTILKYEDSVACKVLNKYGIMYENLKEEYMSMNQENKFPKAEFPGNSEEEDDAGGMPKRQADSKSKTPVLDNFGRDLTKMAELGRLDPIVGREKEIERVSQILSRRKKNNPILIHFNVLQNVY